MISTFSRPRMYLTRSGTSKRYSGSVYIVGAWGNIVTSIPFSFYSIYDTFTAWAYIFCVVSKNP